MSREVRRVPVGWQHPTVYNEHWRFQASTPYGRSKPPSRLHGPTERFVPLFETSISEAQRDWDDRKAAYDRREGKDWEWQRDYHLTGYESRGEWHDPVPVTVYADDHDTVLWEGVPADEDDLAARVPFEDYHGDRPTPEDHMPDFAVPANDRGWCLYETISEGTPTTPVFATAAELIDHLANVGEDYDQKPYRREAAARLVGDGYSMGTFVVKGNTIYDSSRDADVLARGTPT